MQRIYRKLPTLLPGALIMTGREEDLVVSLDPGPYYLVEVPRMLAHELANSLSSEGD